MKFKKTAPYGLEPDGQAMRMRAHIRQADMSWGMGYKFEVLKNSPIWSGTRWSEKLKDKK